MQGKNQLLGSLVGDFGCLKVLYGMREIAWHHFYLKQSEHSISTISTNKSASLYLNLFADHDIMEHVVTAGTLQFEHKAVGVPPYRDI